MTEDEILALPYRPCVGIVVMNAERKLWAGRRIDNASDAWQMPQGGVDKGEDPEAAAFRELEEETSIKADAVTLLGAMDEWIPYDLPHDMVPKLWKGRYRGQTQKWFMFRFNGDDSLINIETGEPEFSHWSWMGPEDLVNKIVPFKRDTYARVFEAFRPHLES